MLVHLITAKTVGAEECLLCSGGVRLEQLMAQVLARETE